jgi:hypothetical protein
MVSTVKLNYDCKALASVINYARKFVATIWSVNLTLSFTIVSLFIIEGTGGFQKVDR